MSIKTECTESLLKKELICREKYINWCLLRVILGSREIFWHFNGIWRLCVLLFQCLLNLQWLVNNNICFTIDVVIIMLAYNYINIMSQNWISWDGKSKICSTAIYKFVYQCFFFYEIIWLNHTSINKSLWLFKWSLYMKPSSK